MQFIATGISNSLPTVAGVFFPVFVLGEYMCTINDIMHSIVLYVTI